MSTVRVAKVFENRADPNERVYEVSRLDGTNKGPAFLASAAQVEKLTSMEKKSNSLPRKSNPVKMQNPLVIRLFRVQRKWHWEIKRSGRVIGMSPPGEGYNRPSTCKRTLMRAMAAVRMERYIWRIG
jgi:hypothetical protein